MISVIIPNYNGRDLLETYLAKNEGFFHDPLVKEVIVVDDCSTDDSVAFVTSQYPQIIVVEHAKNAGFGITCNTGAKRATQPILFFMNSDMEAVTVDLDVVKTFFETTPGLFSLTPTIFRPHTGEHESITYGEFKGGYLFESLYSHEDGDLFEGKPILWGCGGACFVDIEKFRQLNGFHRCFSPYYFEDVDLSYRAWMRGWSSVYTHKLTFHHQHSGTISRVHQKKHISAIHSRNRYLFFWKNIRSVLQWSHHIMSVLIAFLTFQLTDIKAVFQGLKQVLRFPDEFRQTIPRLYSDQQILDELSTTRQLIDFQK